MTFAWQIHVFRMTSCNADKPLSCKVGGYDSTYDHLVVAVALALGEPPETAFLDGPVGLLARHQERRDTSERGLVTDDDDRRRDAVGPCRGLQHVLHARAGRDLLHDAVLVRQRLDGLHGA